MFSEALTQERDDGLSKPRWVTSKNTKKQSFKFSRESSLKSTLLTVDYGQQFEKIVSEFAAEKSKIGLHFHPIMGILKNNEETITGYVLFLNGRFVKSGNFKELLLLYLESFHLFDFHYPTEGRLVCEMLSYSLLDFEITSRACTTSKKLGNQFLDSFSKKND